MPDDTEQPLIYHLIELRDRLLRVVLVVGVVFIALVPFSNTLFSLLSGPLMAHMPDDSSPPLTMVAGRPKSRCQSVISTLPASWEPDECEVR